MTEKNDRRRDDLYDERFEEMSYEEFKEALTEEPVKHKQKSRKKKPWGVRILASVLIFVMIFQGVSILFDTFRIDAIEFLKTSYRLSQNETIQEWKEAVVVIQGDSPFGRSKGTGFFISNDGYLLTNHHVVEDKRTIGVSTENGDVFQGDLIASDEEADLALLKVEEKGHSYLPLMDTQADSKEHIYVIGNPLSFTKIANEGEVLNKEATGETAFGITAPIYRGNSGSPVITEEGKVTGVVYAKKTIQQRGEEPLGLAVPIEDVHAFLEDVR